MIIFIYSYFVNWIENKNKADVTITIDELEKECKIQFPSTFSWSNNRENAKKYWLEKGYIVHKTNNILIFEYNSSLAKKISSGTKFNKSESAVTYALFKVGKKDEFYKRMNFCPCYFKSAVDHFYKTPLKSQTSINGKTVLLETRYNSWEQCYTHFQKLKGAIR